ncbi:MULTISPECIES: uridine kinase [Turicibacter]|jgi:uridine kinase|uniref:Uridine kinase n=2 Tax=Turicibacter sanguinis TaxID=154288 RepID=A0A173SS43_9FIRM|nr:MULTISPECIES: uridine kinase [Turicibacter]EFF65077.1 uridine kinase [Turicibacter sanguinis PC909]EGC91399.1 uridine kinase [Turicibacter sp. HGF1]MBP3903617.1 uridine kinase [Turicibacter sp.]MCU7191585.1 uridine kinase [Turicibacter sanguinis]MCU7196661.1 uridine kinase [Turicibacter sanguinis]
MNKPLIIGVAGGTASGKTSVSTILYDAFADRTITLLRQDDYYNDQSHMTLEERVKTNYDHPLSMDNELLVKHLKKLMLGYSIEKPIYDYTQHTRSELTEKIEPTKIIIVEGLFVLEDVQIRDLLDIKVFVEADDDIRFIRRLLRDTTERGRTIESVISQYTESVKPMHQQFIEPTKKYADIIVPDGKTNTVAIDLLITKINSILNA